MRIVGYVILSLVCVFALSFAGHSIGLFNLKFWAPKYEEAKREVFEETQSFTHGKIGHINRLRLEYESTESEGRKKALRTMILNEVSVLEEENLPSELRSFINRLKGGI
jgi:hypothetical protein